VSRGEVNFSIIFKDDVGLKSSYVMMFEDPLDQDSMQEAVGDLLASIIFKSGKVDDFIRAEVLIDIEEQEEYFCAIYLSEGEDEWLIRETHSLEQTIH
tara:strand:- start:579 stop:872 length:294 start_codon:yes stop_codon:yes gene_type:complete